MRTGLLKSINRDADGRESNTPVRLPRWFVSGVLTVSIASIFVFAGWWWLTWPQRTATEFLKLLEGNRWEEAERLIPESVYWMADSDERQFLTETAQGAKFEPIPRKIVDVVIGRQAFRAVKLIRPARGYTHPAHGDTIQIETERGHVIWLNSSSGDVDSLESYLPTWEIAIPPQK